MLLTLLTTMKYMFKSLTGNVLLDSYLLNKRNWIVSFLYLNPLYSSQDFSSVANRIYTPTHIANLPLSSGGEVRWGNLPLLSHSTRFVSIRLSPAPLETKFIQHPLVHVFLVSRLLEVARL